MPAASKIALHEPFHVPFEVPHLPSTDCPEKREADEIFGLIPRGAGDCPHLDPSGAGLFQAGRNGPRRGPGRDHLVHHGHAFGTASIRGPAKCIPYIAQPFPAPGFPLRAAGLETLQSAGMPGDAGVPGQLATQLRCLVVAAFPQSLRMQRYRQQQVQISAGGPASSGAMDSAPWYLSRAMRLSTGGA